MPDPVNHRMLSKLNESDSGMKWLQTLARAGLKRTHSPEARAAYELSQRVHEVDEAIQATKMPTKLSIPVPKGAWFWVPIAFGAGYYWAFQADMFEDRLTRWMWSLIALAVVAGWVLLTKVFNDVSTDVAKRRRKPRLQEERRGMMGDLIAAREACVARHSSLSMADETIRDLSGS